MYKVRYTDVGGVVQSTRQSGGRNINAEVLLTGLTPSTSYSIQVAAINEEGDVGLYSDPLIKWTSNYSEQSLMLYIHVILSKFNSAYTDTCDSGYHNSHFDLPLLD